MVRVWCLGPLLFAAAVLADYYIDNANTSVSYSMPPSQSGQSWQVFSSQTQSLALQIQNSTGNYTIELDSSNCYDQNYALGVCSTTDNCQVSIPFTGSGISMYVFNAGFSGIAASFSVDGAPGYTNETAFPPPPTYQQSRVLIYDIQGLPSSNHTMVMTVVDWNGSATSMKFDYAYVNETFVAKPTPASTTSLTSSSQTPSQTSSGSSNSKTVDLGGIIGGTLAGVAFLIALVIGILYFRGKRKATRRESTPEATYQATPFMSEYPSNGSPPLAPTTMPTFTGPSKTFFTAQPDSSPSVPPVMRSAILRDAHAAGTYPGPEPSITSGTTGTGSIVLQPLRRQPSIPGGDVDARRGSSHFADAGSPVSDSAVTHYNLTAEQIETIERLQADGVPQETISRVIEGFVTPRSSAVDSSSGITRGMSLLSAAPPPSYQTRVR